MSPRFVLGRENVPCVAEVVNRSLKADCTDFTGSVRREQNGTVFPDRLLLNIAETIEPILTKLFEI